jgi:hypothetical protein
MTVASVTEISAASPDGFEAAIREENRKGANGEPMAFYLLAVLAVLAALALVVLVYFLVRRWL